MPRTRTPRPRPAADADGVPSPAETSIRATGRRRALSAVALEGLGAQRLAALLMTAAGQDAALARTLRLTLAGVGGAGALATAVEKRLGTIARSRGPIVWNKSRPLARELEDLRGTIATTLAEADPRRAAALMRQLRLCCTGQWEAAVRPSRLNVTGSGHTPDARGRASGSVRLRQSRPRSLDADRCVIVDRHRSPV